MKKVLLVTLITVLLLSGCGKTSNGDNTSTDSTSTSQEQKEITVPKDIIIETNYANIKKIFDTTGIVVFYNKVGIIDEHVLNALDELSKEYNVPVYAVEIQGLIKNNEDENVVYVENKIKKIISTFAINNEMTSPDFYEIKDGQIMTRRIGIDLQLDDYNNISEDNKKTLKESYRTSFERLTTNK